MGGWESVQVDDGWGSSVEGHGTGRGRVYEVDMDMKRLAFVNANAERVC